MTLLVEIPLSDDLYVRAQKVARQRDVPVAQLLAEHLEATLPEPLAVGNKDKDTAVMQEWAAYHALHPQLQQEYLGEYVAIYQGKLVDHDPHQLQLVKRLDLNYPTQFVFVRQITPDPEPEYRWIGWRWGE
jgi:hypothetical protein